MKRKVDYKWTVPGDELKEQWLHCDSLRTFPSLNFPESPLCYNWALTMVPNADNMVVCYLDLLRIPAKIKTFEADFKVIIGINDVQWAGRMSFGYGFWSFTNVFGEEIISNASFRNLERLDIRIGIEIIRVTAWRGKVIAKDMWTEYGILE